MIEALPEADRALWALAMWAGLRRGELAALRRDDVNWNEQDCQASTGPGTGQLAYIVAPKSEKGWRTVTLPDRAYDYLLDHGKLPERADWVTGDLIFGRTRTQAFTPAVISKRADAAWKAAGLKRITLHEARHCYASLALTAGLAIKDLQDSLGHGSYSITMDRYTKRAPNANTIAAEKMNAHF